MRDILVDLIKHTDGLGYLDTVRVTGTEEETKFDSIDNDRTIVMKAEALKPSKELEGEFGLSRFGILKGYLKFAGYRTEEAKLSIRHENKNGKKTPVELLFNDGAGQKSVYRFMGVEVLQNPSSFKGKDWDVSFTPDRNKISEFSQLASILSSSENFFLVKTVKNDEGSHDLKFVIGEEGSTTDHTVITMHKGCNEIKGELYWPINQVLALLNLGLEENVTIDIMSKGALRIAMTSNQASYEYYLPARRK